MKHSINIATIFPKHLFWDMDYSKLNLSKDKSIIIPRAFFATTPETFETDIQKLEELMKKFLFHLKSRKDTKKFNYEFF